MLCQGKSSADRYNASYMMPSVSVREAVGGPWVDGAVKSFHAGRNTYVVRKCHGVTNQPAGASVDVPFAQRADLLRQRPLTSRRAKGAPH